MKKEYQSPKTTVYTYVPEAMLASSPGLNDELGSEDQFSNERDAGWDAAAWNETEEESKNSPACLLKVGGSFLVINILLFF